MNIKILQELILNDKQFKKHDRKSVNLFIDKEEIEG